MKLKKIPKDFVICDGTTEQSAMFDLLYPLFAISGIGFFMWFLVNWNGLKEKIKK